MSLWMLLAVLMGVTTLCGSSRAGGYVAGLLGYVGASPHGCAYVGLCGARRVVDPVAGHRYGFAAVLEPAYLVRLVLWACLGYDVVYAQLPGHGVGCRPVVAGRHC